MYQNFYPVAAGVSQYFSAIFLMSRMELWNSGILGMKSGKRAILQEMLNLPYLMMPVRHPFSAFILKVLHQN
jgi:hypothetical protein